MRSYILPSLLYTVILHNFVSNILQTCLPVSLGTFFPPKHYPSYITINSIQYSAILFPILIHIFSTKHSTKLMSSKLTYAYHTHSPCSPPSSPTHCPFLSTPYSHTYPSKTLLPTFLHILLPTVIYFLFILPFLFLKDPPPCFPPNSPTPRFS